MRCDASDDGSVLVVARALRGDGLRLSGVFHAAHQLADAVLANQSAIQFRATYGPKVHSAAALHAASWHMPLRFFNVFSSMAGLMGSPGQAPHSAANAWLDTMVPWRQRGGLCGHAVRYLSDHTYGCCLMAVGSGLMTVGSRLDALGRCMLSARLMWGPMGGAPWVAGTCIEGLNTRLSLFV